jgi:hypothetical protein
LQSVRTFRDQSHFPPELDEAITVSEELVAISPVEKLLRRLNEFDNSEMCSTSSEGMDVKWKLDAGEAKGVLEMLEYSGNQDSEECIAVFMCER